MLVLGEGAEKPRTEGQRTMRAAHLVMFQVLNRGSKLIPDGGVMNETYVLSGLQIDDGQLPSLALCDEGEISTGFDLHGCPERQRKVCSSVGAKVRLLKN